MDKNKKMVVDNFLEQKIIYPVDEKEFDRAYESIESYKKSIIKKSIQLNYSFLKNGFFSSTFNKKRETTFIEGLNIIKIQQKKKGVILFLSREFNSPAQLIGFVLIPRILGIDTFVIGDYPEWPSNLLFTLELLGIFHVYNLDEEKLSQLSLDLDPWWAFFSLGRPIPVLKDRVKHLNSPKSGLVVRKKIFSCVNVTHIQTAHPLLHISELTYDDLIKSDKKDRLNDIDIIYTEAQLDLSDLSSLPLILGCGLETLWFFPQIDMDDFLVEQYSIFKTE